MVVPTEFKKFDNSLTLSQILQEYPQRPHNYLLQDTLILWEVYCGGNHNNFWRHVSFFSGKRWPTHSQPVHDALQDCDIVYQKIHSSAVVQRAAVVILLLTIIKKIPELFAALTTMKGDAAKCFNAVLQRLSLPLLHFREIQNQWEKTPATIVKLLRERSASDWHYCAFLLRVMFTVSCDTDHIHCVESLAQSALWHAWPEDPEICTRITEILLHRGNQPHSADVWYNPAQDKYRKKITKMVERLQLLEQQYPGCFAENLLWQEVGATMNRLNPSATSTKLQN